MLVSCGRDERSPGESIHTSSGSGDELVSKRFASLGLIPREPPPPQAHVIHISYLIQSKR